MLTYFNYFISYSFLGFLLETVFSFLLKGRLESRKCFLLSSLCPVYGLGAIAILISTRRFRKNIPLTFITGIIAATTVELLTDLFYRKILNSPFWDYSNQPFNFKGSVCLKFSLIWGILTLALVYFVHPRLSKYINEIPGAASYFFIAVFLVDAIASTFLLKSFNTKEAVNLAWLVSIMIS